MGLLEDLIKDVPPITRTLCGLSLLLTFLTYVEVVSPYNLYFTVNLAFKNLQIWRLLTNLLYLGEFNLHTCFKILLFYRFSRRLEEYSFRGNAANYLFFLIFGILNLSFFGVWLGFYSLAESFLTMILYYWSRKNVNVFIHIFGLLPIRAPYLTWFFVFLEIIVGGSIESDLLGIITAHVYYFFTEVYPKLPFSKNKRPLKTPQIIFQLADKLNLNSIEGFNWEENDIPNAEGDNNQAEFII